ncbi:MAG: hypothetical protein GY928_23670 [Colwellia sp.]|nr:hypothetical protein [Colwellia sp.]
MIRPAIIKSLLFGRVGWRQPIIPNSITLSASNLQSDGDSVFQDASPFVSVANIKATCNNPSITEDQLNTYLEDLQKAVIVESVNKVLKGQSSYIESLNLYPRAKSFKNTIDNVNDTFVGFKFEKYTSDTLTSKIDSIELSFSEDKTFNIYLYNTNKLQPILTKSVTVKAKESTLIKLSDWFLGDGESYIGGDFYMGYFQSDLGTCKAYKKDWELSNVQVNSKAETITPISLTGDATAKTIDHTDYNATSETHGLNLILNTYTDYTNLVSRNRELFDDLISYAMAARVIDIARATTDTNATEFKLSQNMEALDFELYGDVKQDVKGINAKYSEAIQEVKDVLFYVPQISIGSLI